MTRRNFLLTCLGFYLLGQIIFLIGISTPRGHCFDEFHYVPSAMQFLEWRENQNWEHPPLGKMIMAVGIGIFGNEPLGWRFMSTVFGSLTLVGMYAWGFALFESNLLAIWIALLSLVNNLLYVQARIGMLDTFMMAFMVWAFAAFTMAWKPGVKPAKARACLEFAGAMMGFACACKWFAVVPLVGFIGLIALVRLLQFWKTRFENGNSSDWFQPGAWKGITNGQMARALLLYPFIAYYVTFIPLMLIQKPEWGPLEFFPMQARMWDGQLRVVTNHPYMSTWPGWPFLLRPIWYAFETDKEAANHVRGVLLLGNPLIMFSGLLALAICLWEWVKTRAWDAFLILFYFGVLYFSWAAIPRKISFYYYYYPAGMTLSLAIAFVFQRIRKRTGPSEAWLSWVYLGVAAALFIYFIQILSGMSIPGDAFKRWMWRSSWI